MENTDEGQGYGNILVDKGLIASDQLDEAFRFQQARGGKLKDILIKLGYATNNEMHEFVSTHLDIPYVKLRLDLVDPEAVKLIPAKVAREYVAIPVTVIGDILTIAVSNPFDTVSLDTLAFSSGYSLEPIMSDEEDILAAIDFFSGSEAPSDTEPVLQDEAVEFIDRFEDAGDKVSVDEAPVVRLINQILSRAIRDRASDIHIEPGENLVRVRFNVDGSLMEANVLPKKVQQSVVSRIKILSELDISEKRMPQDGGFFVRLKGKEIDFRVATAPTVYGESVTLRVLDQGRAVVRLSELGLAGPEEARFRKALEESSGFILVTGPTGSGKTTTLYAMLNEINDTSIKVITIEDPVEYRISNISQISVSRRIGLDFAAILRSVLRQAPNVILVGEIRDAETAQVSVQAALTGHMLLSTLHTTGAADAIPRLIDMGVPPYLVREVVKLVIAQRLVKKLCPECKEEYRPEEDVRAMLGIKERGDVRLFAPVGCAACKYTGYRGRAGIFEAMPMTRKLRSAVAAERSSYELADIAGEQGMLSMWQNGVSRVLEGEISVQELFRNVPRAEWGASAHGTVRKISGQAIGG
jgi:type IV pilus assembly protein PilB